MRLLIDGTPLLLPGGGVKNYLYYWLLHLQTLAGAHDQIRVFPFLKDLRTLVHSTSLTDVFSSWLRLRLVQFANLPHNPVLSTIVRKPDVFHEANTHVLNPPRAGRLTATIHDMTCWLMPELHTPSNVKAARRFAEHVIGRADRLVAVSQSTRADAIEILGIAPEKIEVIHPGAADAFFTVSEDDTHRVTEKYGLQRRYILYVGVLEPRKNLDALLDAYKQLARCLTDEFELIVAGPIGWSADATLARLKYGDKGTRYLGYVPEADLPALTAGATVFAYPSLYEGFGLPVAQAMAAGVPIVTSNVASLPEVTAGAAVLVDPRSINSISTGLDTLLSSPSLRGELAQRGRQKSVDYRWPSCAYKSLAFFHRVCGV